MQHVVAAGNGLRPARVVFEIGGHERQAIAHLGAADLEHGAHLGLALQASHRGAHLMPRIQKLDNAMTADKSRSARHQNCAHP